ncbi:MAG: CopG family transcriptional regulator [Pyrodictiaceae archaeon]
MTDTGQEKTPIYISKELYEKARKFVEEQGGFNSVDELVEFLLQEAIAAEEPETGLSKEEEEKVKERLRALGYL